MGVFLRKVMRLPFLFFIILGFTNSYAKGNSQSQVDSIARKLEALDKKLSENNYVRVPEKDLDDKLTNMIANEVNDTVTSWLIISSIILGAFGGVAIYATRKYINDKMREEFKVSIDDTLKEKLSVFSKELELIKSHNLVSRRSFYETELTRIKKEVADNTKNKIRQEVPYEKLVALIDGLEEIKYFDLIPAAIDEMVRLCYTLAKDEELDKYVSKYSEHNLTAPTYLNAALVPFYKYVISGTVGIRKKLMDYLEKSLNKIHDYGDAKGLKLITYMIDYDRATLEKQKRKLKEMALSLTNEINSSTISPLETIRRLRTHEKTESLRKYIVQLYELLPDEMQKMEEKANKTEELSAATIKSADSLK